MLGWVPRVVLPGKTADVEIRESGLEPQRLSDPPARAGRGGRSLGAVLQTGTGLAWTLVQEVLPAWSCWSPSSTGP